MLQVSGKLARQLVLNAVLLLLLLSLLAVAVQQPTVRRVVRHRLRDHRLGLVGTLLLYEAYERLGRPGIVGRQHLGDLVFQLGFCQPKLILGHANLLGRLRAHTRRMFVSVWARRRRHVLMPRCRQPRQ